MKQPLNKYLMERAAMATGRKGTDTSSGYAGMEHFRLPLGRRGDVFSQV